MSQDTISTLWALPPGISEASSIHTNRSFRICLLTESCACVIFRHIKYVLKQNEKYSGIGKCNKHECIIISIDLKRMHVSMFSVNKTKPLLHIWQYSSNQSRQHWNSMAGLWHCRSSCYQMHHSWWTLGLLLANSISQNNIYNMSHQCSCSTSDYEMHYSNSNYQLNYLHSLPLFSLSKSVICFILSRFCEETVISNQASKAKLKLGLIQIFG